LNETDKVDFPTFVSACVKLDGSASSIDVHVLSVRQLHGLHQMSSIQNEQHEETKVSHQILQNHMAAQLQIMSKANIQTAIIHESNMSARGMRPLSPKGSGMSIPPEGYVMSAPNQTSNTSWSEVEAQMQKQFTAISGEIKEQLQTMQKELKSAEQSPSGDGSSLKGRLPGPPGDLSYGTPRTLSRNLMAETEKAKQAQEQLIAKTQQGAEAERQAQLAKAELELQKRNEEELQHKLMQQDRVHERTLKEVVSQTHSREAELKMLVKSQAVRLEQMQYQLKTNSRDSTPSQAEFPGREGSAASAASAGSTSSFWECAGSREAHAGPSSTRNMADFSLAQNLPGPLPSRGGPGAGPIITNHNSTGYQGGDYR